MNKLYYTTTYHTYNDGSFNGLRTINVYEVENNIIILLVELECKSDDIGNNFYTDEEEINNWLYEEVDFNSGQEYEITRL